MLTIHQFMGVAVACVTILVAAMNVVLWNDPGLPLLNAVIAGELAVVAIQQAIASLVRRSMVANAKGGNDA